MEKKNLLLFFFFFFKVTDHLAIPSENSKLHQTLQKNNNNFIILCEYD